MIKYLFSKINYAGKISVLEDQRKLEAHIVDLFSETLAFCRDRQPNLDQGHFGFPEAGADQKIFAASLPPHDPA